MSSVNFPQSIMIFGVISFGKKYETVLSRRAKGLNSNYKELKKQYPKEILFHNRLFKRNFARK